MPPSPKPRNALLKTLSLLVALALSLAGCAAPPQLVPVTPALPTPPALSTPLPQTSYSTNVQALLSRWQKLLTGTSPTSEPPAKAGPSGTSSPSK